MRRYINAFCINQHICYYKLNATLLATVPVIKKNRICVCQLLNCNYNQVNQA